MPTDGQRRLSAEARRAQLLDVAVGLAAGGDIAAVSVAEIAAAAGVSEGLLYHYFPTKQALVQSSLRRAADALLADIGQVTGATPAERLLRGLSAYLDHVEAQPTGWLALLSATGGELAAISDEIASQSRAVTLAVLGVAEPGPALSVALSGWEAFEREACADWLRRPDLERSVLEQMLADTFFAALGSAARHDPTAAAALRALATG